MALKIRLARAGRKGRPFHKIVVADSRKPRDGRFIEKVGTYNPLLANDNPNRLNVKEDRVTYWLGQGATPSLRVAKMLGKLGLVPMPEISETPKKSAPKEKAKMRAEEKAEKLKARQEAEEAAKAEESSSAAEAENEAEDSKATAEGESEAEKTSEAAPQEEKADDKTEDKAEDKEEKSA